MVWLKLDRAYFGLPQSIYLCVAYLAPDSSSYAKNAENFKEFKNGIDHYASLGHLAVIGDLNARVGTRQETVMSANEQGINSTHGLVNKLELSKRNNEDNTVNARGQKLFDLATNYELFLANGRSCGDLTGKYTCCQWNGQSVVDVFMAQSDVLSRINYFKIGKFDWYSDHAPISVDLAVDIAKYIEPPLEWKKVVKQLQRWDNDAKAKMKDTLIKEPFVSLLENFCNTSFASSADAANSLTSILQQAIKKVFPRKHRRAIATQKFLFLMRYKSQNVSTENQNVCMIKIRQV